MATIFNSDLETENSAFETEWTTKVEEGANALAISTTAAHVHTGTNGAIATFDGTNNECYASKTVADQDEVYLRAYVKFNSAFEADGTYKIIPIIQLKDDTQYLVRLSARSQATATTFRWYAQYWNGSGNTTVSPAVSASLNEWHLVELHWVAGSGFDGGIEIKVDGDSIGSSFVGTQSAARCDTILVGSTASGSMVPTADSELYFDDFASDDTAWVGGTGGVDVVAGLSTMSIQMYNPVVATGTSTWDMGPYVYTVTGTTTAVNPPSLQTSLQIHNPVVYAVDVPTAVAPPLLQTNIQMFNPNVNVGTFRNRIASMLHLIMGR